MDFNDEISQLILESDKDETCRHSSHQIESWMLDYEYVAKCQDVSTLKGILKILISGREGRYPDLEKTVEKKILSLLPEKESNRIKKSSAALCRSGTKKDDRDGDGHEQQQNRHCSGSSTTTTTTVTTTSRIRREEEQFLDATNDLVQWAELMGSKEKVYSHTSRATSGGGHHDVVTKESTSSSSTGGGEEERALNTSSSSFVSSSSGKHTSEVPIRAKVVKFYGTRKTTSTDHDFMKRNNKKYISTNSNKKNSGIPAAERLVETSTIRQKKQGENLLLLGGNKKTNPVERICKERLSNRDYFRAWDKFNVEAAEAALDRSTSSTDSSDDDYDDDLKLENLVNGNHRNDHATKPNSNLVTVIREEDYHTMDSDDEEKGSRLDACFLERLKSLSRDERKFMAIREKEKGNECYRLKQYEMAMDHYSKSIAFDGENAVVYANRAMACIRNGKKTLLPWALDDCNKALEIDPGYIKALARRGKIYQMNGQYQDALRDFANCVRKEPSNEEYEKLWMEARKKHCPPRKEECDEQSKRRIVVIEEEDDSSEHEEKDVVEEIYTPGCSRKS